MKQYEVVISSYYLPGKSEHGSFFTIPNFSSWIGIALNMPSLNGCMWSFIPFLIQLTLPLELDETSH